jgi:hypothetical protein
MLVAMRMTDDDRMFLASLLHPDAIDPVDLPTNTPERTPCSARDPAIADP